MTTVGAIKDLDQLVVRLERNHRCVLRQINKMNSYRFEPKDYECFIRLRDLRLSLKQLSQDQMNLFDQLQRNTYQFNEATELVEEVLQRFKKIEGELASYLLDTKGYY
ncbi:hypothetical protein [Croceitalea rosinachiae]|uniref:Uncharacterized protein n=1 Tax=Croceitalea rosinachiae TaxID=3075596 RepID=A0ABU3ABS8_9FLAO|nr:hypothetical protein [Croceitalea sp. F388]MDT0607624.1 hypothetical protein [Croceitalea sp. F388]